MPDGIYLVVEGDGEETAAPELVRRILYEHFQRYEVQVRKTYNAQGRGNLTVEKGLERFLQFTRSHNDCAGVIVILDTEEDACDCPPCLAGGLAQRARNLNLPFPVAIVCATCEYESWFLYNMNVIAPKYNMRADTKYASDPEQECSAKGWLTRQMPNSRIYKETQDQVKMTAVMDITHTMQQSRSFKRMVHAVELLLIAIENIDNTVTPLINIEDCR